MDCNVMMTSRNWRNGFWVSPKTYLELSGNISLLGNSNNNKRSASSVVSPPPSSFDSSTTTSGALKPKPGSHLEELSTLVISHTNEAAEGFNSLFNSPEFDKQSKVRIQ